ncbi:MAG: hypothetical protein CV089_06265 [Nitrospira sp. WS110]|nr:hypothetical protein [Nitrospira sp. WS110]
MSREQRRSYEDLVKENEALHGQLEEANEVLTAIRTGTVDALVVEGPKGEQVYSLTGADHQYRIFVEHMNEGAVTVDENGVILYANRLFSTLVGLPLELTVGRELPRFLSPDERLQWDELIRAANGKPSRRELALLSVCGESIPILLSARRLPTEPGRCYCCIVSDLRGQESILKRERVLEQWNRELAQAVTEKTAELVQSQNRLRALTTELNLSEQRERKRLATELHDYLAQLLVVGKMHLDLIKRKSGGPLVDELDETLDKALSYTRTLVAQLSPPFFHELGLPYAFKWLAEQLKPRGLRVKVEVEDGRPSVTDDHATLLFQAARELLMNVVKHAGTDEARLAMTIREGTVRIEVSDDGSGFDGAALNSAAASGSQGGFGLFSIRERMLAMGGRFEMTSRTGEGTRATLITPLSGAPTVASPPSELTTDMSAADVTVSHAQSAASIRILLVDDHAMIRQGLRSILNAYADVEVVGEAAAGDEAVALVDQLLPSVVVMDINMPKMNGIEATTTIKTRHPSVVVIGLSVQADVLSRSEMLRAGAAALVTKEAAVEELHHAIQGAVNKS